MFKKTLLALGAVLALIAGVVGMSAFEAHVINVTAQIENALQVDTTPIDFGTVFPQEYLAQPLKISLSESFQLEDRVDDVEYIIRQKPKCGWVYDDGMKIYDKTRTGHVETVLNEDMETHSTVINCEPTPETPQDLPGDAVWMPLPLLCPYISKTPDITPNPSNNSGLPSFHQPYWADEEGMLVWNDSYGRLSKMEGDIEDNWLIDLAVPCFGDHCAQDWESFVHSINPNVTDPMDYVQPITNEHKLFGCDLWVEVGGISRVVNLENKDSEWQIMSGDGIEGKVSFNKRGDSFKGVVTAQGLKENSRYQLTINGPGSGEVGVGSTNDLIAKSACLAGDQFCGGWWDGSLPVICQDGGLADWEGFYVFDLADCSQDVASAMTDASGNLYYAFDVPLQAGSYSGVKFLIKENFSPWQGVMFETEPLDFIIE